MSELDPEAFLAGQRDCMNGIEHQAGRSESYDRGYSTQYTLEQIQTEQTNYEHRNTNSR